MTIKSILHHRLRSQQLIHPQFTTPSDLLLHITAIQSQDYEMSKWSVGLRLHNTTENIVESAINDGHILRTHILRPTWHLVSPKDIRWMQALTSPYVKKSIAHYDKKLELTPALYKKTNHLICKALENNHLTRPEIKTLLDKAGIQTDSHRLVHIMIRPELDSLICSGTRKGKHTTYALLDERVPATKPIPTDEAIATLALRYFTSHGPATLKDFSWWSGLPITIARDALHHISHKLEHIPTKAITHNPKQVTINHKLKPDSDYYFLPQAGTPTTNSLHLLPNFDEFLIAYANSGGQYFKNTLLLNGEVAGNWKREIKKDQILLHFQPFDNLPATKLKAAEKQYLRFMIK